MAVPVVLFIGLLIGVHFSQPRKNRVLALNPETGRGVEYEIDGEDNVNVYCPPVGNTPPQRFIKRQDAFNIIRKGAFKIQTYALWLAMQGSAYTRSMEGNENEEVPFRDAVKNVLGKELYRQIPNNKKDGFVKDRLEESALNVTVKFPNAKVTPDGLPSISSDDMRRNDVNTLIAAIVRGVNLLRKPTSGEAMKIIFILGSGIAIGIVLSLIFGWGNTTVIQPSGAA